MIEPQRDSHGKRWFTYAVFVRLNRPIPRDGNGSPLGEAPLDGAGGVGELPGAAGQYQTPHLMAKNYPSK